MHPDTSLGPVHLTVADTHRAMLFYGEVLGLRTLQGGNGPATNGAATLTADGKTPLLVLHEHPGARPKPPHTTGLYHYAMLLPTRPDLARALWRLSETRHPIEGASDHLVSEALYLADLDGNGIEIYADRPRDVWPRQGDRLRMATDPLDVEGLMRELKGTPVWQGLPAQTRIGHVHLHVADLRRAEAFYHEVLGFDLMLHFGHSAAFLSAGGYHHHIGLNTWAGVGAPTPPPDAAGLRFFTVQLPDNGELDALTARLAQVGVASEPQPEGLFVRDPSTNGILVVTPASAYRALGA